MHRTLNYLDQRDADESPDFGIVTEAGLPDEEQWINLSTLLMDVQEFAVTPLTHRIFRAINDEAQETAEPATPEQLGAVYVYANRCRDTLRAMLEHIDRLLTPAMAFDLSRVVDGLPPGPAEAHVNSYGNRNTGMER